MESGHRRGDVLIASPAAAQELADEFEKNSVAFDVGLGIRFSWRALGK
jgi:hypothetical protein